MLSLISTSPFASHYIILSCINKVCYRRRAAGNYTRLGLNKRASNTWSYIVANGTTALQLPLTSLIRSGEVIVHIQTNSSPFYCYSWTVMPGMLNTDGITLIDGYKTGNFEGFGQVYINNKIAQIMTCKIGGNNYINDCKLILYYCG